MEFEDAKKEARNIFTRIDNGMFLKNLTDWSYANDEYYIIETANSFVKCNHIEQIYSDVQELMNKIPQNVKNRVEDTGEKNVELIIKSFIDGHNKINICNFDHLYKYLCAFNIIYNKLRKHKEIKGIINTLYDLHSHFRDMYINLGGNCENDIDKTELTSKLKKSKKLHDLYDKLLDKLKEITPAGHDFTSSNKGGMPIQCIINQIHETFNDVISNCPISGINDLMSRNFAEAVEKGRFDAFIVENILPIVKVEHDDNQLLSKIRSEVHKAFYEQKFRNELFNIAKSAFNYHEFNRAYIKLYRTVCYCVEEALLFNFKDSCLSKKPKALSNLLIAMNTYFVYDEDDEDDVNVKLTNNETALTLLLA